MQSVPNNYLDKTFKIIPFRLCVPAFHTISTIHTLMVATRQNPNLVDSLRKYRLDQAYQRAIPTSAVFSNSLLYDIANTRPTCLTSLQSLHGIGPTRCERYGRDIVRLVNLEAKRSNRSDRSKRAGHSTKAKLSKVRPARKPVAKGRKMARGMTGTPKDKPAPASAETRKKPSKASIKSIKLNKPNKPIKPIRTQPKPSPKIVTSRFFPAASDPPGSDSDESDLTPKIPTTQHQVVQVPPRLPPSPKASVYVLELEDGRVYVGSSRDVQRRISQHAAGSGSAYTRVYRPTGVQLPRLGNVQGDGDAAERDETLRYMMQRGIPYVRGWKFSRVDMPPEEFDEAEANIREVFDLCRRCGYKGHFCTHCRATFDRLGSAI